MELVAQGLCILAGIYSILVSIYAIKELFGDEPQYSVVSDMGVILFIVLTMTIGIATIYFKSFSWLDFI